MMRRNERRSLTLSRLAIRLLPSDRTSRLCSLSRPSMVSMALLKSERSFSFVSACRPAI